MRTLNLTPFLAGTKVTSRKPPKPEMTVVVRAAYILKPGEPLKLPEGPFPLSQGSLSAEGFEEADEARVGETLYPGDFADFKLKADVLLRGMCHAPRGRAVSECPVRFTVGSWSKTLRVIGHRAWVKDASGDGFTEPLGFTSMPIGYISAFGGRTYQENPVGKGFGTNELPNVEHLNKRVRSPSDRIPPAGFGPINPSWPPRAEKLGKEYGELYMQQRFPFYAEDFDWSYFNAAPPDQQIEGYLKGDEEVSFSNLTPNLTDFQVVLPGLRVRAFVNDKVGCFREVRMNLDTLFADLLGERLFLTWRGVEPVVHDDLFDVKTLLVATERLAEKPRAEAEYRSALTAFENDPVGFSDAGFGPDGVLGKVAQAPGAPVDPLTDLLRQKLGSTAASEQAQMAAAVARMRKVKLPPGVSLDALLSKAVNDLPKAAAAPISGSLTAPRVPLGAAVRKVLSNVAALKAKAAAEGRVIPGLEKLEGLASDPRFVGLDPSLKSGQVTTDQLKPGVNLPGADLRGLDLSGMDLRRANLEGALLSGAVLRSSNLTGANLAGAMLFEADLSLADLTDATLNEANLSSVVAEETKFTKAKLHKVNARKGNFAQAVFIEAECRDGVFEEANFGKAKFHKANFENAIFDDARFDAADLAEVKFVACRCERISAKGAGWERATLTRSTFAAADLEDARFLEVNAVLSVWIGANLTRADFRFALLQLSHFLEAKIVEGRFRGADLREARFYRADLTNSYLGEANLLRADLCKANLTGAKVLGANFFEARFLGATLLGVDFSGANLQRAQGLAERGRAS